MSVCLWSGEQNNFFSPRGSKTSNKMAVGDQANQTGNKVEKTNRCYQEVITHLVMCGSLTAQEDNKDQGGRRPRGGTCSMAEINRGTRCRWSQSGQNNQKEQENTGSNTN